MAKNTDNHRICTYMHVSFAHTLPQCCLFKANSLSPNRCDFQHHRGMCGMDNEDKSIQMVQAINRVFLGGNWTGRQRQITTCIPAQIGWWSWTEGATKAKILSKILPNLKLSVLKINVQTYMFLPFSLSTCNKSPTNMPLAL